MPEVTRYVYSVWFRNAVVDKDDHTSEWVTWFYIDAETAAAALAWGDHLAHAYASRNLRGVFVQSDVTTPGDPSWDEVFNWGGPVVVAGQKAPDELIGW